MDFRSRWAWPVAWLWVLGHWPIDCGRSPTIDHGNALSRKRTITMSREKPSLRPGDESTSSNRGFLRELLEPNEARQALFFYLVGTGLLIGGGIYSLWRISLLSAYMADNRAYVLARDARWEQHIQGQAEAVREILRRLPEPKQP
jgi:hypothetical protein